MAARTFVAWTQGFVNIDLAGAFRSGRHVDAAFEYGLERLTAALAPQIALGDELRRHRVIESLCMAAVSVAASSSSCLSLTWASN